MTYFYRLILLVLALALLAPAAASADASLMPSTFRPLMDRYEAQVEARSIKVAEAAWPTLRENCPDGVSVSYARWPGDVVAYAYWNECHVKMQLYVVGWYEVTCDTLVHEFGHLALGEDAFAKTNPEDPTHSPDPHSIMYWQESDANDDYPGCVVEMQKWKREAARARASRRHNRRSLHAVGFSQTDTRRTSTP